MEKTIKNAWNHYSNPAGTTYFNYSTNTHRAWYIYFPYQDELGTC